LKKESKTHFVKIYMSGPIEEAKQIIRKECLEEGLCVNVRKTDYVYTGGEETGFVVELLNYPRFPITPKALEDRASKLAIKLLDGTFQHSVLLMGPIKTTWISKRRQ